MPWIQWRFLFFWPHHTQSWEPHACYIHSLPPLWKFWGRFSLSCPGFLCTYSAGQAGPKFETPGLSFQSSWFCWHLPLSLVSSFCNVHFLLIPFIQPRTSLRLGPHEWFHWAEMYLFLHSHQIHKLRVVGRSRSETRFWLLLYDWWLSANHLK